MMSIRNRKKAFAFTLIELLIVVAIIGILAAIAVPNFMNARTRATIARVKSEIRSLATSSELYRLDTNTYPNESEHNIYQRARNEAGLMWLTTPIAYMASLPSDPFYAKFEQDTNYFRCYETSVSGTGFGSSRRWNTYVIFSIGPDQAENGIDSGVGFHGTWYLGDGNTYMASNGLKSHGDIYWFGGDPSVVNKLRFDGKIFTGTFPPNFAG